MKNDHAQLPLFSAPDFSGKGEVHEPAPEPTEVKTHNPPKIPLYAFVDRGKKVVKGRVLSYEKNGYFTVLLPDDTRVYRHRTTLRFTNHGENWRSTKKAS